MSYPIFGNLSLGNVSGNIKLFVNHSGLGNLTGIGYNNNAMTFGVNQSATDTPEMIINRIGDVDILGNVFTGGNVVVNAIAPSTSITTGALQVAGGVGIQGNIFLGGNLTVQRDIDCNGNIQIDGTTASVSTTTGALQVAGGAGIVGNVYTGGNVVINAIVPSTSTTTGALQVAGGAGIRGNIFLGGNLITGGDVNCNGNIQIARRGYIGPPFTGSPDVSGTLVINEAVGTVRGVNSGSLVISHNNSFGNSSIVFPSRNNTNSDYAYIEYQESSNTGSGESGTLIIGIENDAGTDNIVLYSAAGTGRVGVNTLTPQTALDVNGTLRLNAPITQTYTAYVAGTSPSSTQIGYTFTTSMAVQTFTSGTAASNSTNTAVLGIGVWLITWTASFTSSTTATAVTFNSVVLYNATSNSNAGPVLSGYSPAVASVPKSFSGSHVLTQTSATPQAFTLRTTVTYTSNTPSMTTASSITVVRIA